MARRDAIAKIVALKEYWGDKADDAFRRSTDVTISRIARAAAWADYQRAGAEAVALGRPFEELTGRRWYSGRGDMLDRCWRLD